MNMNTNVIIIFADVSTSVVLVAASSAATLLLPAVVYTAAAVGACGCCSSSCTCHPRCFFPFKTSIYRVPAHRTICIMNKRAV